MPPENRPEQQPAKRTGSEEVGCADTVQKMTDADRGDPPPREEQGSGVPPGRVSIEGNSTSGRGIGVTGRDLSDSLVPLLPDARRGDTEAEHVSEIKAKIEITIRSISPGGESKSPFSEVSSDTAIVEAKEILVRPHQAHEVDPHKLEDLMIAVLDTIRQAPPEELEKVAAAVVSDPPSSQALRRLMASADEFRDAASRAAEHLNERDRSPQPVILSLVLAAACLLGGGVAIPIVLGAKMELIYTNAVAAASLVCAGAALAKS